MAHALRFVQFPEEKAASPDIVAARQKLIADQRQYAKTLARIGCLKGAQEIRAFADRVESTTAQVRGDNY